MGPRASSLQPRCHLCVDLGFDVVVEVAQQSPGSNDCFTLFVSLCRYHLKQKPLPRVDRRTQRKKCRARLKRLLKAIDCLLVERELTETDRGDLDEVERLARKVLHDYYFTVHDKRISYFRESTIMEQMLELCLKLNKENALLGSRDRLMGEMECFYEEVKAENHAEDKDLLDIWEWLRQVVEDHSASDSDSVGSVRDEFGNKVRSDGYMTTRQQHMFDSDA